MPYSMRSILVTKLSCDLQTSIEELNTKDCLINLVQKRPVDISQASELSTFLTRKLILSK
jgi:hypothetical protein